MLFFEKIMLFFRVLMKNLTLGILIAVIFLLIQGVQKKEKKEKKDQESRNR